MKPNETSIFERMLAGGLISFADPEYPKIFEEVPKTIQQSLALNTSTAIGHRVGALHEDDTDESNERYEQESGIPGYRRSLCGKSRHDLVHTRLSICTLAVVLKLF